MLLRRIRTQSRVGTEKNYFLEGVKNKHFSLPVTCKDIKELNAEIIRTFIEKVYVYGNEKPWDRNTKKIKVIFNFIGEVHIPSNVKTA